MPSKRTALYTAVSPVTARVFYRQSAHDYAFAVIVCRVRANGDRDPEFARFASSAALADREARRWRAFRYGSYPYGSYSATVVPVTRTSESNLLAARRMARNDREFWSAVGKAIRESGKPDASVASLRDSFSSAVRREALRECGVEVANAVAEGMDPAAVDIWRRRYTRLLAAAV